MKREHTKAPGGKGHPGREQLIDLVDGSLEEPVARELHQHLASCAECRAYVDSLETTLARAAAGSEGVPEQPAAYWQGFEAEVRRRVRAQAAAERGGLAGVPHAGRSGLTQALMSRLGRRWRLALVLSPGVAVAIVFAVTLALRGPEAPAYTASDGLPGAVSDLEPPLDAMSVGEIARSVSEDAALTDMVIEAAGEDINSIEQYLLETEDIGALIDGLAAEEAQGLAAAIADRMKQLETRLTPQGGRDGVS